MYSSIHEFVFPKISSRCERLGGRVALELPVGLTQGNSPLCSVVPGREIQVRTMTLKRLSIISQIEFKNVTYEKLLNNIHNMT